MNNIRKVFFVLTAMALATLSLPSSADNGKKMFNLQMSVPAAESPPPFTVQATITNEGNSQISSFSVSVTGVTIVGVSQPATGQASFTGSSASVTNMHPLKSGQSLTVTLNVNTCGDAAWSPVAWNGSSLNGQSFNLVGADSELATSIACGPPITSGAITVPDSINQNCGVSGTRGFYDKNGNIPNPVPYYVTNTVPSNGLLHFRWPVLAGDVGSNLGLDAAATFEYTICAVGTQPPLPPTPGFTEVAWLNTDGSPTSNTTGNPVLIAPLPCLAPDVLPAPYGTLTADLSPAAAAGTTIPIDATTPSGANGTIPYPGSAATSPNNPGSQFDVVIGTERIRVQLVCTDNDGDPTDTSDCTETSDGEGTALQIVQRGVAYTSVADHPAQSLVMSTPLPILPSTLPDGTAPAPPYQVGHQAQICIANENDNEGTHSTTFIDIGDGWVNHP